MKMLPKISATGLFLLLLSVLVMAGCSSKEEAPGPVTMSPDELEAWEIALVFSIANAALLWHRVRIENAALAGR